MVFKLENLSIFNYTHTTMAFYSENFRKKVLDYYGEGTHTLDETVEYFRVPKSSISRWRKLQKETGGLKDKKRVTKTRKIDLDKLKTLITEKPDLYQSEIAESLHVSQPSVCLALKSLGLKRKKKHFYTQKEMRKNGLHFAKQ